MITALSRRLLESGFLFFCAVLCCLSCADSSEDTGRGDGDVVIGLIAPLSISPPAANGAILAVSEINAAGGISINGSARRIELLVEDSLSRPEIAVSKALKLINRERVVALIGVPRSFNAIPVAKIAESHEVPLISTMSTHPETTAGNRYAFRLGFVNSLQGRTLADFTFHDLGLRRAAVLYDTAGAYSSDLAMVFRRQFESQGGRIVAFELFTEDDLDVAEHLLRIQKSDPEILFLPQRFDIAKQHARDARRLGLEMPLLGSDTWSYAVEPCEETEIHGAYFSDFWAPSQADETTSRFIENYRGTFAAKPSASAALSYDAVSMVAAAIRQQGQADGRSIRAGLVALDVFRGVSGRIEFGESGDPARSIFIKKIETDGSIRLYKEIEP